MADLQKVFDTCRVLYKKCYDNVRGMSADIARIMEKEGKDWDPKITSGKFDIVLQYSLLQIAVADFDFDRNELIFIRDLTEQGDFVHYLNSISNTNLTWDNLYNAPIMELRKVLKECESLMMELSEEFVNVFAICDGVTEYNYLKDLQANYALITISLMGMDGSVTDSETSVGTVMGKALYKIGQLKKK